LLLVVVVVVLLLLLQRLGTELRVGGSGCSLGWNSFNFLLLLLPAGRITAWFATSSTGSSSGSSINSCSSSSFSHSSVR
jgi:hypothetical protein